MRYPYSLPQHGTRTTHVGTYQRVLPVSLERMYENALDWEHLPHLHRSSFMEIDCLEHGAWGWRASVTNVNGTVSLLELRLDRACRRWITRNLTGPHEGAEIWTHVFVISQRLMDIVVDFFVPDVPLEAREKVGRAYARQYERLYDEDVLMMSERQAQLDGRIDSVQSDDVLELALPEPGMLPVMVELSGRSYLINRHQGDWVVYPAVCPHRSGPLTGEILTDGSVVCPWHGYRFDVRSGACISGRHCRFGRVPQLSEAGGKLVLSWSDN